MQAAKTLVVGVLLTVCFADSAIYNETFDGVKELTTSLVFPGVLQVNNGTEARVILNGTQELIDSLDIDKDDDELRLDTKGDSSWDAKDATYQIWVPQGSLKEVRQAGAGTLELHSQAISNEETFDIHAAGNTSLYIKNATGDFDIEQEGSTTVVIEGSPRDAEVESLGASQTFLLGVTGEVEADGAGAGTLFVNGTGGGVTIKGEAKGVFEVHFNEGTCSVTNPNPTAKSCVENNTITLPTTN